MEIREPSIGIIIGKKGETETKRRRKVPRVHHLPLREEREREREREREEYRRVFLGRSGS